MPGTRVELSLNGKVVADNPVLSGGLNFRASTTDYIADAVRGGS